MALGKGQSTSSGWGSLFEGFWRRTMDSEGVDTWNYVRELRKKFEGYKEGYELDSLNQSWELLSEFYSEGFDGELIIRSDDERTSETPIGAFRYYIEMGFYPPPEILMAIADAFEMYFKTSGKLSLEEAFFGPEKKWVGNKAVRKAKDSIFKNFNLFVQLARRRSNKCDLPLPPAENLAEDYFNSNFMKHNNSIPDIDTFLRNYRRWKAKLLKEKKGKDEHV